MYTKEAWHSFNHLNKTKKKGIWVKVLSLMKTNIVGWQSYSSGTHIIKYTMRFGKWKISTAAAAAAQYAVIHFLWWFSNPLLPYNLPFARTLSYLVSVAYSSGSGGLNKQQMQTTIGKFWKLVLVCVGRPKHKNKHKQKIYIFEANE